VTADLDGFHLMDDGSFLMSFDKDFTHADVGTVQEYDIVRFTPTSLGATTAGTFSMYFDGSDVGFDTFKEDIDALTLLPDGRLLISTVSSYNVPGVSGQDEDLIAFTPATLGENTSGAWELYFDGEAADLAKSGEDVTAAHIAADNTLYLSVNGNFAVPGLSGSDEDVFVCQLDGTGANTACTYQTEMYFTGADWGLVDNEVDAVYVP
jgi:hypothetical protein